MTGKKANSIDPLYQLFEHYLVTRSYEDTAAFTKQLAEQYLAYLDSTPAHVPFQARTGVLEDLANEAHEMLVKKMYGCVRVSDYFNYGAVVKVERHKKGFGTFDFTEPPPAPPEQNSSNK
jgi:hypothetical protein